MKINENTYIPLGWLIVGIASTWTIAAAGAFWVAGVNHRLARIEKHMGIYEVEAPTSPLIREANAGGK